MLLREHLINAIGAVGMKYILVAGGAYSLFYIFWRKKYQNRKIQAKTPKRTDYRREIMYSLQSVLIMAAMAWLALTVLTPYNQVYFDRHEHSFGYYCFSIVCMLLVHDTYFYWMHRLVHHPKFFRFVHLVHHRSTNPSPWAAYAFHPLEAVFEGLIPVLITFILPVHWSAVMVFFTFSIFHDVYIHLGYELLPATIHQTWLGRYLVTSVNHNQHHRHFDGNYGLYFTFWDRLMGTLRSDYEDVYQKITRPQQCRIVPHTNSQPEKRYTYVKPKPINSVRIRG